MASFSAFAPKLLSLEGGFVNHPLDRGGPTNHGITMAVLERVRGRRLTVDDVRNLTKNEALGIYKNLYWNPLRADEIASQQVAEILVDWKINGGLNVKAVQRVVGAKQSGVFGADTVKAVNAKAPRVVFDAIMELRKQHYDRIIEKRPDQKVFYRGWLNRLRNLNVPVATVATGFGSLVLGGFFFGR